VTSRSRLTSVEWSPVGRLLYGGRLQCAVGLISYTDEGIVLVEGVGGKLARPRRHQDPYKHFSFSRLDKKSIV